MKEMEKTCKVKIPEHMDIFEFHGEFYLLMKVWGGYWHVLKLDQNYHKGMWYAHCDDWKDDKYESGNWKYIDHLF